MPNDHRFFRKHPSATVLELGTGKSREISVATIGQAVNLEVGIKMVSAPCAKDDGYWYCDTHHVIFRAQFLKDDHIHNGDHKLVWLCHLHGPEMP